MAGPSLAIVDMATASEPWRLPATAPSIAAPSRTGSAVCGRTTVTPTASAKIWRTNLLWLAPPLATIDSADTPCPRSASTTSASPYAKPQRPATKCGFVDDHQRTGRIEADAADSPWIDSRVRDRRAERTGACLPDVFRRLLDDVSRLAPRLDRPSRRGEQRSVGGEQPGAGASGSDVDPDIDAGHALTPPRFYVGIGWAATRPYSRHLQARCCPSSDWQHRPQGTRRPRRFPPPRPCAPSAYCPSRWRTSWHSAWRKR